MIRITGLTKRFRDKRGEFTVLNNVSVNLPEKGLLFFTGKSGSGKSTFLYLLGGIQGDYGGTIEVDGDIIGTYGEEQWNEYRNGKVGFVFQNYGVFEHGSVMDNVLLPTEISECSGMETEARARELLDYVGLVGFEEVPVSNLSGGEKQRVAIARAMMNYPLIILADEPTGNLDGATSKTILALFRKISETCLVCIVSHDRTAAEEYGDAVYELRDGGLLEIGGNNSLKYDVVVTADGAEKGRATGLSATQLQSYLQKEGLLPEGSSAVTICLRRGCEPVLTDGGPTGKERSEEHGVKRVRIPLSFRSSFKKAFDKGLKGWIRTVAGGVTLALLTGLAFALWNLHMYRPEKAIREYLTDFNVPFVTAEMTRSFRNLYEEEEERTISSGKYYMNELTECLDGNMTIPIIPSANLTDESGVTMVFADIFVSEEILPCCTIRGRKPETPDEIAVSEQIAAEYGITEPPVFSYGAHGKPVLVGRPEIHFNLSHCREAVVCVLSDRPVGIDVEAVSHYKESVARYTMNERELREILEAERPDVAFTRLWTMKEAVLKLSGEGLRDNLKEVLADVDKLNIQTVVSEDERYVYSVARGKE